MPMGVPTKDVLCKKCDTTQVCELIISTAPFPVVFHDEYRKRMEEADSTEKEVRTRLTALGFEIRDGRLAVEPILGRLD